MYRSRAHALEFFTSGGVYIPGKVRFVNEENAPTLINYVGESYFKQLENYGTFNTRTGV